MDAKKTRIIRGAKGRHLRFQVQEVVAKKVKTHYEKEQTTKQCFATRAAIYDVESLLYIYIDVWQGTNELYRPRESPQVKIKIGEKEFIFEDINELLTQLEK